MYAQWSTVKRRRRRCILVTRTERSTLTESPMSRRSPALSETFAAYRNSGAYVSHERLCFFLPVCTRKTQPSRRSPIGITVLRAFQPQCPPKVPQNFRTRLEWHHAHYVAPMGLVFHGVSLYSSAWRKIPFGIFDGAMTYAPLCASVFITLLRPCPRQKRYHHPNIV